MSDLVRYNSFDELKASSDCTDTDIDRVKERHDKYQNFMCFLSRKRVKHSPEPEKNSSRNRMLNQQTNSVAN